MVKAPVHETDLGTFGGNNVKRDKKRDEIVKEKEKQERKK
jgi:hypothetical protein